MTRAYKIVDVKSHLHFMNEVRDFMVTDCGWTDQTPNQTTNDDWRGQAFGYLLYSNGEDGNKNIPLHMWTQRDPRYLRHGWYTYLDAAITTVIQMTFDVMDTGRVPNTNGLIVQINDEMMKISSVAAGVVTVSERGWGGTTPTTHSANDMVVVLSNTGVVAEIYAHRDLTKDIVTASGTETMGRDTVTTVPGLSGYGNDKFNDHAFIKVQGEDKWRIVYDYTDAGTFIYEPFRTAPGDKTVELYCTGYNPPWSWRFGGTSNNFYAYLPVKSFLAGSLPGLEYGLGDAGVYTVYMYGDKDGVYIHREGYATYLGIYHTLASVDTTTTTQAEAAGQNLIHVTNRHYFVADEKYRIMSRNSDDWGTNEDRSSGYPSEPDLYIEELPQEEFLIQSIAAGAGDTGTLTLTNNLTYNYASGAVVGENPSPLIRSAHKGDTVNYIQTSDWRSPNVDGDAHVTVHSYATKNNVTVHNSHRGVWWMNADYVSNRWGATGIYWPAYGSVVAVNGVYLGDSTDASPNNLTGRYQGALTYLNNSYDEDRYGACGKNYGTLPFPWILNSVPGGAGSGDTMKARWGAQYETFRVLLDTVAGKYVLCGPEL